MNDSRHEVYRVALDGEEVAVLTATSGLDALSQYAEGEGFVRYDKLHDAEREQYVYTREDGAIGAVFLNGELAARPAVDQGPSRGALGDRLQRPEVFDLHPEVS